MLQEPYAHVMHTVGDWYLVIKSAGLQLSSPWTATADWLMLLLLGRHREDIHQSRLKWCKAIPSLTKQLTVYSTNHSRLPTLYKDTRSRGPPNAFPIPIHAIPVQQQKWSVPFAGLGFLFPPVQMGQTATHTTSKTLQAIQHSDNNIKQNTTIMLIY